jgi:hypothetical protein
MGIDVKRLRAELDELSAEMETWTRPNPPGIDHWRDRLNVVMSEIPRPADSLDIRLAHLQWSTGQRVSVFDLVGGIRGYDAADLEKFKKSKAGAAEIIRTLRWHLDRTAPETAPFSDATVDPELWEHVRGVVEGGEWEKVAREAAVFVETKLREWALVSPSVTGSVNVFKTAIKAGTFELGHAGQPSEVDGWRQLATGFALALRNPTGHQVKNRPDAKRYALAVLGTASLLLTELRYEYGDPPKP